MFCASVVYPVDAVEFNFDYFCHHHAPMFAKFLGETCVRFEVHRGLATPGAPPPPFAAVAYFWVTSAEAFGRAVGEHGAVLYGDIANFSRTQPTRGWAEVVTHDGLPALTS